jgi:hypothetical protein
MPGREGDDRDLVVCFGLMHAAVDGGPAPQHQPRLQSTTVRRGDLTAMVVTPFWGSKNRTLRRLEGFCVLLYSDQISLKGRVRPFPGRLPMTRRPP